MGTKRRFLTHYSPRPHVSLASFSNPDFIAFIKVLCICINVFGPTFGFWSTQCIKCLVRLINRYFAFPVSLSRLAGLITDSSLNTHLADAKLACIFSLGNSVCISLALAYHPDHFSGCYMFCLCAFCPVGEILWIPPGSWYGRHCSCPIKLSCCWNPFFYVSSSQRDIIHHRQSLCTMTSVCLHSSLFSVTSCAAISPSPDESWFVRVWFDDRACGWRSVEVV